MSDEYYEAAYFNLKDRYASLEGKLWAAVDRAEKAEARHTALVEAATNHRHALILWADCSDLSNAEYAEVRQLASKLLDATIAAQEES